MLLAGVGKALRLYELGKRQLLRKCENNVSNSVESQLTHVELPNRDRHTSRAGFAHSCR